MVIKTSSYTPGALVQARGRNWVVLPADEDNVVRLRPVDGSDEEAIGIFLPIEQNSIRPSEYDWPNPDQAGNFQGGLLLRDAVRLTLRSGAGGGISRYYSSALGSFPSRILGSHRRGPRIQGAGVCWSLAADDACQDR